MEKSKNYSLEQLEELITELSFPDILKINQLWAELQIRHQHFVDM
jgi:hypothetical protein